MHVIMRIRKYAVLILCTGLLWGCDSQPRAQPQLYVDESVAPDLQAVASGTWSLFLTTFATRTDCFGDVHLRTDPELTNRALYEPKTQTVTVRVPGTPAFLQAALVHEWAHHIEFQCDAHKSLRPDLLTLLDLSPETPWHIGHKWEDSPSEQYAEAVVELVLGDHPLPTKIWVNQEVVAFLGEWAKGD